MLGYAAYLVPLVLVVVGWHYFWCRKMDAAYTKLVGATLLFGCVSSFLSLAFGSLEVGGQGVPRRRLRRRPPRGVPRGVPEPDRIDHPDPDAALRSRSSCRPSSRSAASSRALGRIGEERCAAMRGAFEQRRDEKRAKAAPGSPQEASRKRTRRTRRRREPSKELPQGPGSRKAAADRRREGRGPPDRPSRRASDASKTAAHGGRRRRGAEGRLVAADAAAGDQAAARRSPRRSRRCRCPSPTRRRPSARKARTRCRRYALLDAPKAEQKIDERELMDGARLLEEKCREFSVEGTVVQIHPGPVVTTYEFKPDAGVKYSEDHRPRRRPLPRDAGRVGPHRPHPGQVDGRHRDPEPEPRADLAARAARVRRLQAVAVEADAGARQDHPRRAVRQRPRDDAASAHRRLDRRRQVGQRQRDDHQHPVCARRPTTSASS